MQTIDSKLKRRIYGRGRGSVFTPKDVLDLGGRDAVDKALSRLATRGEVGGWRAASTSIPENILNWGLYRRTSKKLRRRCPAKTVFVCNRQGAYATNLLGLSEQVPAKAVFLTDGPSRTVKIGRKEIQLRHTTPRNMAAAGRLSGLLMQAFRHLGQEHITPQRMAHLKRTLPAKEREQLSKDLPLAPTWMHSLFRELAEI